MGWSSYIHNDGGFKPACFGTAAGPCGGFVGAGAGTGGSTFDAATAAKSFHDSTTANSGTAAYV